ncbi:hypothetical protein K9M79_05665 [Candidatus Woesearchaeota archaeon]|nr:hypothetical protein [Candidatus Woesearchaeota archaeon]
MARILIIEKDKSLAQLEELLPDYELVWLPLEEAIIAHDFDIAIIDRNHILPNTCDKLIEVLKMNGCNIIIGFGSLDHMNRQFFCNYLKPFNPSLMADLINGIIQII